MSFFNKLKFLQASTTKSSKKVPLFFYTLYIEGEGSGGSGEGEVIVRVNIKDVNDNPPVFRDEESEIVASVPTTAQYGHHVTRIQVSVMCDALCHACLSLSVSSVSSMAVLMTPIPRSRLFITEMLVSRSFKHRQQDSAMHIIDHIIISPCHQSESLHLCPCLNLRVKAVPKMGKNNISSRNGNGPFLFGVTGDVRR